MLMLNKITEFEFESESIHLTELVWVNYMYESCHMSELRIEVLRWNTTLPPIPKEPEMESICNVIHV